MNKFTLLAVVCMVLDSVAVPTVSNVSLSQDSITKAVTVQYTLSGAPAVITASFLSDGELVEDACLRDLTGDVNRLVGSDGTYSFVWQPARSYANRSTAALHAGVTAWAVDHPPLYMVVDLAESATQRVNYYTSEAALPGGIASDLYRTSRIVLRRIDAKDTTFQMGTSGSSVSVTLTNDYYMGVFEVTKAQWMVIGGNGRTSGFDVESSMRPMANVCYVQVRWNALNSNWGENGNGWPMAPVGTSYLGKLRTLTKVDFDLPAECEWEYACRAGHAGDVLGDGSDATEANLAAMGRYSLNGGIISNDYGYNAGNTDTNTWTTANGTAKVGSYKPNDWGLYDMHGNVHELCLGWWVPSLSDLSNTYQGYPKGSPKPSDPKTPARGGCYTSGVAGCMSSSRAGLMNYYTGADVSKSGRFDIGFRVCCPAVAR